MADVSADLLTAASDLLRTDGPSALSVRRVAEAAGCSTMAIYSRFGGKSGLLDALAREGFHRLADAVAAAAGTPPDEIAAMCAAMREVAIADPLRYRLMFGPLAELSSETRAAARRSLSSLTEAIARAAAADVVAVPDPLAAAGILFGMCHGLIGAELSSVLDGDGSDRLMAAIEITLSGLGARSAPGPVS